MTEASTNQIDDDAAYDTAYIDARRTALAHGHENAINAALGWENLAQDLTNRLAHMHGLTPSVPDVEEWWEAARISFTADLADIERRMRKLARDAHAMAGDYRLAQGRLYDALHPDES